MWSHPVGGLRAANRKCLRALATSFIDTVVSLTQSLVALDELAAHEAPPQRRTHPVHALPLRAAVGDRRLQRVQVPASCPSLSAPVSPPPLAEGHHATTQKVTTDHAEGHHTTTQKVTTDHAEGHHTTT
jgi:hypothetical protein